MKRVFVTGGSGVIGLEIVPRLLDRGMIVMVGDLKERPSSFPPNVIYWKGDLNGMTGNELLKFDPDTIIHLAATFERSTESYGFWYENYNNNVALSHHVMTLAKDIPRLCRVVFASSYLIYDPRLYQFDKPRVKAVSLNENDAISPRNLTGMAKLSHEMELKFISGFRADQISIVSARIFRGYGCNSRDVISRWVRSLLRKEPILVFRLDGIFDYIFSADSAEGLIRLAEAKTVPAVVNLGTGRGRRVKDVINILKMHFGSFEVIEGKSDILFEASQADMSLFYEEIKWMPQYDLEKAIPKIIEFESTRISDLNPLSEKSKFNVLITSAGAKVPLIRAAKDAARKISSLARVIAGDISNKSIAAYVADEFWLMPPTTDEYLSEILDGCRSRAVSVVVPTRDGELKFWSQHKAKFAENGIAVIVSSLSAVELCLDKLAFAEYGLEHNLPLIPASDIAHGSYGLRYVVKERYGSGSRGVRLDLDRKEAITHSVNLSHPIFQPFVVGDEFSVDAWVDEKHSVQGLVLRWRNDVIHGESRITTTFLDAEIESKSKIIIEKLALSGPVVLQGIVDREGATHFIECNARFGGASTASIAAGLDLLYWSFQQVIGIKIDARCFVRSRSDIRQVRVSEDIQFYDNDF